ncbi:MAG: hypothetical protein U9O64_10925 [Campylobacterota bacterium]|nr:hypothetical protein [Campylobacterota bacterium]
MKSLLKFIQIRRSVKQHATIFSLVVVIMLFGLFMEAYMHNFNLVYITLFFVFAFAFSAGHFGMNNIIHLQVTFAKQGRIFANKESQLRINIHNTSKTDAWAIVLHGKENAKIEIPRVKLESKITVLLPCTIHQRGNFTYTGCFLESKYPLSTARLTRPIKETYSGLAYPEPKGISLHSFISQQETHLGEEKEFDGLSSYDGTQKLSHLHWASVAKGEMAVKRFTKETKIKNLNFIYDTLKGDKEIRLSQLTLWVLECEKQKLNFEIVLPKRILRSHKESIDAILETLAHY